MLGTMSKWIYDRSPTDAVKFETPLAELKASIASSGSKVFQDMIRELLIENTHRTVITMVPSKTLEEETVQEEQDRLAAIKAQLSEQDMDKIIADTAALKEFQAKEDSPEDRATIPSLQLSDLKREETEYPIAVTDNEKDTGITVVRHELVSTSGIIHARFGVDLSNLSLDDAVLLPLFTRMLTETGAGEYDDVALARRIGTYTGGVRASTFNTPVHQDGVDEASVTDCSTMVTKLVLSGKATADRAEDLFSLFHLILTDARLDSQSKVVEMLKETKSQLQSSIQGSGHSFALQRMRARYTAAAYISEKTGGITYYNEVQKLLDQAENDWPALLARLEKVRSTILEASTCRDGMFLDLTGDNKVLETVQPEVEKFLTNLPGDANGQKFQNFYKEEHPWVTQANAERTTAVPLQDEGFVVPTQVNYVGKGGLLYKEGEAVHGSANVVSKFLRTGYLWDQVRVIGGAYGGFCVFAQGSGFFGFVSYRDPNLSKTLNVYDATADALMAAADEFEKDPEALATTIIGAVGEMDSALSPDQKGWTQFQRWITNESPERRQQRRNQVISTTPDDFRAFADRLRNMRDPSVAVISSKGALETAATEGNVMKLTDVV